jgi:hypothetical protein
LVFKLTKSRPSFDPQTERRSLCTTKARLGFGAVADWSLYWLCKADAKRPLPTNRGLYPHQLPRNFALRLPWKASATL